MSKRFNLLFQSWRTFNLNQSISRRSSTLFSHKCRQKVICASAQKHNPVELPMKHHVFLYSTVDLDTEHEETKEVSRPVIEKMLLLSEVVTNHMIKKSIRKLSDEKEDLGKLALKILKMCKEADRLNVELIKEHVEYTWRILCEKGKIMEEHCEEYLHCHIKNMTTVNPQFFLTTLIKCNVFVSYKILCLLLECACNKGLIEDINFILMTLEEMKYPITEEVHRTLMMGKAKLGEMDEVLILFKKVESVEGIPSRETYVALLKAIACSGDVELLNNNYKEALEIGIEFSEDDVLSVLEALAFNNHYELIPEVLEWKSQFDGKILRKFILKLISHGYFDVALVFLPTLSEVTEEDTEFVNVFIKRLVQARIPFDDILSACYLLLEKKASKYILLGATHSFLLIRDIEASLKMFQILIDNELPVRPHYFWPLIITAYKKENEDGVFKILKEMKKFGVDFDRLSCLFYIFPHLDGLEPKIIFNKVSKETGWKKSDVFELLVYHFLHSKKLHSVYNLITDKEIKDSFYLQKLPLIETANYLARSVNEKNIELFVDVIAEFQPSSKIVHSALCELRKFRPNLPFLTALVEDLKKKKLFITRDNYHFIVNAERKGSEQSPSIIQDNWAIALRPLVQSEVQYEASGKPDAIYWQEKIGKNQAIHHFNKLLQEKESKKEDPSFVLCNLLGLYVKHKDFKKAVEIKNKIKELSVTLTPGLKSTLLQLSVQEKDVKSSISYYEEILAEHPDFEIDSYKLFELLTLLVENNLSNEALEILETSKVGKFKIQHGHIGLLETLAKSEKFPTYEKFVNLLLAKKHVVLDSKLFYPLMKWYLENNKLNDACALFKYCVEKYKVAPTPIQLIYFLVEDGDHDKLEKILQLYQRVCGKLEVRTITSFAYAETGRIQSLKNYLKENQFSFFTNNSYASKLINYLVSKGDSKSLETLFLSLHPSEEAMKLIPYIFKSYASNSDKTQPFKFLEKMTEMDIQLPTEYNKYIASVIKLKDSS